MSARQALGGGYYNFNLRGVLSVKNLLKFSALAALLALVAFGCSQDEMSQPTSPASGFMPAALDGDETLGDPVGLTLEPGSGFVTAGLNLFPDLAGSLDFTVPMGVTVEQVILYWEGQHTAPAGDADITVNATPVTGDLIGGPNFFYTAGADYYSSSYRADITALNFVVPGANSLAIAGMDFGADKSSGVGVFVIYSEPGMPEATIMLKDGNDLAYIGFPEPQKSCVPQEFMFAAAMVDRQATFVIHAGSVQPTNPPRPDYLDWWMDLGDGMGWTPQTLVCNPLSTDEPGEWALAQVVLTIPAGAVGLKFQPVSGYCGGYTSNPQSFAWIAGGLVIEGVPTGEGCTPGYWKNIRMHGCNWTGYATGADFDATFGVNIFSPNMTLLQALNAGGGGWFALGRHAVSALLNAASADVNYPYSTGEVIALVQDAYAAGDPEPYKNMLAMANEVYCPLGNCK